MVASSYNKQNQTDMLAISYDEQNQTDVIAISYCSIYKHDHIHKLLDE